MSVRGLLLNVDVDLVTEQCFSCHVLFAMPGDMRQRLLDKPGTTFYCPNGHAQHYTGKSEAQKERERADNLERRLACRDEDLRAERASHAGTKGRLTATKGQLTKTRKRVANGVCPCCNRSFANLARHMSGQHPDFEAQS